MANQAWQITSAGTMAIANLGDVPKPGPKQVLLRIHAFSLNYRDILVVDHSPNYPLQAKPDLIPGSDGAGIVEEPGTESRWKKGDHVVIHPNTWLSGTDGRDWKFEETLGAGHLDGTFRRWMLVDDEHLTPAPKGISLEEACTLYTAGVTAYRALYHGGVDVKPGTTLLTQGTGGVSCYAIMIAAAAGATVIATSSSDEKLEIARKLGATHLVNYRKHPDWSSKVLEATNGKGVDLVVDVIGAESIEQTVKCTAFAGRINITGVLSQDPHARVDIMTDILFGAKTLCGQLGAGSRQLTEELCTFMEKNQLHPPIAESYDFEEADKAVKALAKLSAPGKIVVRG